MINLKDKTLSSQRLSYRLVDKRDFEDLHIMLSDQAVTEPAGFKALNSTDEFRIFFEKLTYNNAAIAILKDNVIIGYIHVNKWNPDLPQFDGKHCVGLGFVIGKQFQNNGYATEALITITAYLKKQFDFCFADHFEGNIASGRVIEKSGYKYIDKYTIYFDELEKNITCISYVY